MLPINTYENRNLEFKNGLDNVWHLFVIRHLYRGELQKFLSDFGIQTLIHYPIPPHKQLSFRELNDLQFPITEAIHEQVLSLPISQVMTLDEAEVVVNAINSFYK